MVDGRGRPGVHARAATTGWYDADVADGADPADARLRADRTLAFYTGQEEPA